MTEPGPWRVGRHVPRHIYYGDGDDERAITIRLEDGPRFVAALNNNATAIEELRSLLALAVHVDHEPDYPFDAVDVNDIRARIAELEGQQ